MKNLILRPETLTSIQTLQASLEAQAKTKKIPLILYAIMLECIFPSAIEKQLVSQACKKTLVHEFAIIFDH